MNPDQKIKVVPDVLARSVGNEIVILDLASGMYFGLDPVGARMWQLIDDGKSLGEIRDAIGAEYEARAEEIERDLVKLVEDLSAKGLVSAIP